MMPGLRKNVSVATSIALLAVLLPALASGAGAASNPPDPLAAEIERWLAILKNRPDTDPVWAEAKQGAEPALVRAEEALRNGRRLLALQRLATAQPELAAAVYVGERPAEQRKDQAAFDAEWARMGRVLRADDAPSPTALEGLPAAVRALGEAALPQVREYYRASLDYGHNTMLDPGLYYLGQAQAQRDLVTFYRTLPASAPRIAAPLRSVHAEIEALQAEILAAYRPPLSIDRHDEFITVSSTLKEARELDEAGLRYGALLRYLQAAYRFLPLRPASPAPAAPESTALAGRLRDLAARLSAGGVDHSLGQMFLESAEANAAGTPPAVAGAVAIANDVLPRYFAALEPEPARPKAPEPQATVTVVRWPYTCNLSDPAALLTQSVVQGFGGKVRFAVENYGDSDLAKRFGVKRYPAIFVDDVLVATPKDFGFYGKGEGEKNGRYAPLHSATSHERFRADLSRMIDLILTGHKDMARAQAATAEGGEIEALPAFTLTDLDGKSVSRADLAGRVVLVEIWATWCPPCRGTLGWLGELKKRHGDRLTVVALAVESDETAVRKLTKELGLPLVWAMGTPDLIRAFGDVSAVPTLLLFDREGRTAASFFGAPPSLHAEAEAKVAGLIE